jgi:hypothetical protein
MTGLLRDPEGEKLLKSFSIFKKNMKLFLYPNPSSELGICK